MRGYLAEFEHLVLIAALRLGDTATAPAILAEIERCTGRQPAAGSIYVTLDRLEEKGLLASQFEEGTPARGGRPRRFVAPTPAGVAALRESRAALTSLWQGMEERLEHG